MEVGNIAAHRRHLAYKFMADCHRDRDCFAWPGLPFLELQISPTDRGAVHTNQHVIDADLWNRDLLHPQSWLSLALHQSLHLLRNIHELDSIRSIASTAILL